MFSNVRLELHDMGFIFRRDDHIVRGYSDYSVLLPLVFIKHGMVDGGSFES
jgi:hypothetical protein